MLSPSKHGVGASPRSSLTMFRLTSAFNDLYNKKALLNQQGFPIIYIQSELLNIKRQIKPKSNITAHVVNA
jgi:hypothetical protein